MSMNNRLKTRPIETLCRVSIERIPQEWPAKARLSSERRPRKSRKIDEHAAKSLPARTDSETVGYGRPPKEYQFKKGKSGNPRGRRPGAKNQATILHEILFRMIPIRDRGKVRKVPLIEAMLLKFAEDALRGNPKAAAFLLSRYGLLDQHESPTEITRDEEAILNAFVKRIQTRQDDNT